MPFPDTTLLPLVENAPSGSARAPEGRDWISQSRVWTAINPAAEPAI